MDALSFPPTDRLSDATVFPPPETVIKMTSCVFSDAQSRRFKSEMAATSKRPARDVASDRISQDGRRQACPPPWSQVVDRYGDFLTSLADRQIGADLKAKCDASDVVQETLLDVFREVNRFEGLPEGEFRALLVRMMLNNLRSFSRRYRNSRKRAISREVSIEKFESEHGFALEVVENRSSPSERLVDDEDIERLKECLDQLPERDRSALTWRMLDGLSYREIGAQLGCSSVTARKLCLRVAEKLRRELGKVRG